MGTKTNDAPVKNYLETGITYLKRPKFQWLTVQRLGTMGGGLNAGIAMTRFRDDPLERVFIEKKFKARDVVERTAHKEITLLKQVGDHAHITKMYDHFIDEEARTACVYLEHCDKGSLLDALRQGGGDQRINEHKLWGWLIQIMEALVYCHLGPRPEDETESLNWATIYHRDVKPGNILLTRDKTKTRIIAKLADFGCAISDEWTFQTKDFSMASKASAQTPGYDPPEYPKFSGVSDVWQLALVFVCICHYEKEPPRSRMYPRGKQWDQARPGGPYHSRELSWVLRSCLVEDTTRRPGALKSLKYIIDAYSSIQHSLPADPQPLEILEQVMHENMGARDAVTPSKFEKHFLNPNYGYAMADSGHEQFLKRPGLCEQFFSDPEAGRIGRVLYHHVDALNSQRSRQDPYSAVNYPAEALYPQVGWYGDEEDPYYMQGSDPLMFEVDHQHQGFYPPLHPRLSRFGRRY